MTDAAPSNTGRAKPRQWGLGCLSRQGPVSLGGAFKSRFSIQLLVVWVFRHLEIWGHGAIPHPARQPQNQKRVTAQLVGFYGQPRHSRLALAIV